MGVAGWDEKGADVCNGGSTQEQPIKEKRERTPHMIGGHSAKRTMFYAVHQHCPAAACTLIIRREVTKSTAV